MTMYVIVVPVMHIFISLAKQRENNENVKKFNHNMNTFPRRDENYII